MQWNSSEIHPNANVNIVLGKMKDIKGNSMTYKKIMEDELIHSYIEERVMGEPKPANPNCPRFKETFINTRYHVRVAGRYSSAFCETKQKFNLL